MGRNWARKFVNASEARNHDTGAINRNIVRAPTGLNYGKGTPKNEPFTARHEIIKVLATWSTDDEYTPIEDRPLDIRVYTPSTELRLKIVLTYESKSNNFVPDFFLNGGAGPVWAVYAVARNPESGQETLLKRAYPASAADVATTTLPDAYELDSAAAVLYIATQVSSSDMANSEGGIAASGGTVNLMAHFTWEPNTEIAPARLAYLYSLCSVVAPVCPILTYGGS